MKILVLALSGIGDALMFTPALRLIRSVRPNTQIDVLVMYSGSQELFERNPDVDKVIYFDFMKEGLINSLKFVLSLRGKYRTTINVYPSNRKEYNIINFLIGAERRAGVRYLRKHKSNLGWLNNIIIEEDNKTHNVQENVRIIEQLASREFKDVPGLRFFLTEGDKKFAANLLTANQIAEQDVVIGFHPGCSTLKNHSNRRWEPEKFAELGKILIENNNCKIFLFGGPEETELKNHIKNLIDSENCFVINSGDLPQSAAVMSRCNVFVTNDSSLMHVASALSLKVVAIIGPTNPNYIHPWKTEHKIVSLKLDCAPCFYYSPKPLTCSRTDMQFKCIKDLDVNYVYDKVLRFL